jgi:hypothetical protein
VRKLTEGLQKEYRSNEIARALFSSLIDRRRNTLVTKAEDAAEMTGAKYADVVALFRQLEKIGAGNFRSGRRGQKTRIEWVFDVRELAAAARGDAVQIQSMHAAAPDTQETSPSARAHEDAIAGPMKTHRYRIRSDLEIQVELPINLTSAEANRLGFMIQNAAFET